MKKEKETWNRCIREEIICALWLIAGLLAYDKSHIFGWVLFVKSASDFCCCILVGLFDAAQEIKEQKASK